MKRDEDPTDESGPPAHDELDVLLRALPRGDLDAARAERVRRRAHLQLRRATMPSSLNVVRVLEPVLLAVCAACGLTRLALVLLFLWRAAL